MGPGRGPCKVLSITRSHVRPNSCLTVVGTRISLRSSSVAKISSSSHCCEVLFHVVVLPGSGAMGSGVGDQAPEWLWMMVEPTSSQGREPGNNSLTAVSYSMFSNLWRWKETVIAKLWLFFSSNWRMSTFKMFMKHHNVFPPKVSYFLLFLQAAQFLFCLVCFVF